ncbi:Hypothetical protein GLP15_4166 [Giardia lamblia P15]|uniref:Uncharacterized protein n=1 Tax=Giardia intestinalis (strain P15) TaxID=658858 RepID=E1F6K7_GIAIA|nr:Hypothetical protein GLP15_4166 [Giardia lamblia P15]
MVIPDASQKARKYEEYALFAKGSMRVLGFFNLIKKNFRPALKMYLREGFDVHTLTDRSDYSILSELVDGSPAIPAYSDSEIDASVYHSFSFDYPRSYSSVFGQGTDFLEFKDVTRPVDDGAYDSTILLDHNMDSCPITNLPYSNSGHDPVSSSIGINALCARDHPPGPCSSTTPPPPMFRTESSSRISAATPPVPTLLRSIDSISNFTSLPVLAQPTTTNAATKAGAADVKPGVETKARPPPKSSAPSLLQMKKPVKHASRSLNNKSQYKFPGTPEVLKRSIQLIYRALRELRPTAKIPGNVMDSLAQRADTHVYILAQDRRLFHWLETEHPKDIIQALLRIEGLDSDMKSRLAALFGGS